MGSSDQPGVKVSASSAMILRFAELAASAVERVLAYCFIAAVLLNFTNVVDRYLFDQSILSADELQVFLLIAMVFLGLPVVTWRRQHLRMDVIINACPAAWRGTIRVTETLIFVAIASFVTWESFLYSVNMYRLGRTSDMAGLPMWIPHGLVALGFGLSVLALAARRLATLPVKRNYSEEGR